MNLTLFEIFSIIFIHFFFHQILQENYINYNNTLKNQNFIEKEYITMWLNCIVIFQAKFRYEFENLIELAIPVVKSSYLKSRT